MRWAVPERLAESEPVVIVRHAFSLLRERAMPPLRERAMPLNGTRGSWSYQPFYYPEKLPVAGRICRYLNHDLLRREINTLLPVDGGRIVCYDSPTQYSLVGRLGEALSLYLAIDDRTLTVTGQPVKGELEAEQKLLGRVNGVICVSAKLTAILQSRTPGRRTLPIHVLPNGYDERVFNPEAEYGEPEFLRHIPRPRLLVTGHVSQRIDWPGIAEASRLRPQWSWVFVGPADTGMPENILGILGKRGFWHPQITVTEVPAWIRHCDACAVPYRLNNFTCASSPLKAIEYLAMGAPVLSTRVPSLEHYGDVILWVDEGHAASYAEALDRCLSVETDASRFEARQQAVKGDSWGARTNQFRAVVFNGIAQEGSPIPYVGTRNRCGRV
jgi:glycosyltransferase involved in cell wall biosynthesis